MFPNRPPPPDDDDPRAAVRAEPMPMPMVQHRPGELHVIGGVNDPIRPELLRAVKHWHKGSRNRVTGEVAPWSTLVLTHIDSGRQVRQFDVRPDENDEDLAYEINQVINSHGRPLANNTQITQNYQLDAYFHGRPDPQGSEVFDVQPSANMDGIGYKASSGNPYMRARGTPQDFEQQRFRHGEQNQQMVMGLVHVTVHELHDQVRELREEVRWWRNREQEVQERERKLKREEYEFTLAMKKEENRARRNILIVSKLSRYLPILASRLDQKLFGIASLSAEEKQAKSTEIIRKILSKIPNTPEGAAKFDDVLTALDLSDEDKQQIKDVGVMFWLDEEKRKLEHEAEVASKGGFVGLGDEIKGLLEEGHKSVYAPNKQIGDGSK